MADDMPSTTTSAAAPLLPEDDDGGARHRRCCRWRRLFPSPAESFSLSGATTVWGELGGAVGDLGTYIPIILALTIANGVDLGTTLIFTAAYNAVTGYLFGIPMPVQPMKAIASIAISSSLTPPQIAAAGISTAAVLLILGATGLMSAAYNLIPLPVVRGVQISQGLSFAFTAVKYIRYEQDFSTSRSGDPRRWIGLDGLLLALIAFISIVIFTDDDERRRRRKIPIGLLIFILGLAICFVRDPSIAGDLKLGPPAMRIVRIGWEDWKIGFLLAAVPQIPLSVLNSVIAVCKLSADLFPEKRGVTAAAVSVSVGAMNLVGCWFGAAPVCHGAGGLAGQYRFGGRSGASVGFLAAGKMAAGMVLGSSFGRVLREFPIGVLGVLLLFSGVELAMAAREMVGKEESFVMIVTAAVSLAAGPGGAALGFVSGVALFVVLRIKDRGFCCSGDTDGGGADELPCCIGGGGGGQPAPPRA